MSIFHHDSSQRQGLLDELLNTTITGISSAKNPPRHCPVKLDGNKHIQMCSALIIQLVQVGHAAHGQSLHQPCTSVLLSTTICCVITARRIVC